MINRSNLWRAGSDALKDLGLTEWKVWYVDDEPETLMDHAAVPESAFNIKLNLVTDDGRFLNLRLRLTAQQVADSNTVYDNVKAGLINRIRQEHVRRVQ